MEVSFLIEEKYIKIFHSEYLGMGARKRVRTLLRSWLRSATSAREALIRAVTLCVSRSDEAVQLELLSSPSS
jgi:hypothetical protein